MKNVLNFFLFIIVVLFFFIIFRHYTANQNFNNISLYKNNFKKIFKKEIVNLPVLRNDTNNVIEYNSGYNEEIKNEKSRSFWQLLKFE